MSFSSEVIEIVLNCHKLANPGANRVTRFNIMLLPIKGGLRQAIHPRLQLQTRVLSKRRDDEGEDQRQAHENSRQDHLGG